MVARTLGTIDDRGEVRPQVTASALGLGPNGTQRIARLKKGGAVLHWDEAWIFYRLLGWLSEPGVVLRDVQRYRRAAARAEASAGEQRASSSIPVGRERRRRGA